MGVGGQAPRINLPKSFKPGKQQDQAAKDKTSTSHVQNNLKQQLSVKRQRNPSPFQIFEANQT